MLGSTRRAVLRCAVLRADRQPSCLPPAPAAQWGTACSWHTGWFNEAAGKVACYQMGFARAARLVNGSAYSSDYSLPLVLGSVACEGTEESLDECGFDWADTSMLSCDHAGEVGLACTGGAGSGGGKETQGLRAAPRLPRLAARLGVGMRVWAAGHGFPFLLQAPGGTKPRERWKHCRGC